MISYVILYDISIDIMYDITNDISILSVWYQSTYHKRSCMISEMISSMISKMIAYMMERCLYQQPKMRCIERCWSRTLQVQVQDVQNRWWSSALLDKARLVLSVRRILLRRSVSQYPCTGELEILKALAWRDNPLYAGSSFLKWNTPPARIQESVGHSELIESDITICTQLEFHLNIHSQYSNWSVSEDVKQRTQNYLQFMRTEQFE